MKHLHLVIPDLLLPHDVLQGTCAGLKLPFLTAILARSQQTKEASLMLENILCESFGVDSVAPVRAVADGLAVGVEHWLCADPVHLQLQQSQVILQPDMQCNAEEAAAFCLDLNRHFAQDGLTFIAADPQRWYIHSAVASKVTMTPLRMAAWRDVKPYQPQDEDALHWRRLSNEIQMLLHEHPVNQSREARGLLAINSLWLWGAGCSGSLDAKLDVIGGDESVCSPFAHASGVPYVTLVEEMLRGNRNRGLWAETSVSTAWQRGDLYAWRDAIQWVERELAQPLWQAIRQGRLQTLTLDVLSGSETRRFVLDRSASWKLWRRPVPMAAYVV